MHSLYCLELTLIVVLLCLICLVLCELLKYRSFCYGTRNLSSFIWEYCLADSQKDIHDYIGTRWGRKRPEGVITKVMRKLNGIDSFISLSVVIASWMCIYVTMYSTKHFHKYYLLYFN